MTLLADRYLLSGPLGSGGMAEVVAAHDQRLGRDVAIKLIRTDLLADPTSRARLLREARAAAALHHPHVVTVYDVHDEGERPFIVMELVKGGSLADRLRDEGALEAEEVLAVGVCLLEALAAAHAAGLVHRDVKPSNILFTRDGRVKLADFGIVKALAGTDPDLTVTGQIPGTPRYLAPELAAGADASPASDLYAVGAVLYQCATGQPPFVGPTPLSVVLAHQRDPLPSLQGVAPEVPVSLAATIQRALQKTPEARFASAEQMRDALIGELDLDGTVPLPVGDPHHPHADAPTSTLPDADGAGSPTEQLATRAASGEATGSTGPAGFGRAIGSTGSAGFGHATGSTGPAGAGETTGSAATADASEPSPPYGPTREGSSRWQRLVGIAVGVLVVGGLLVGTAVFLADDTDAPEQSAEDDEPTLPHETSSKPLSLDELIADLARDPDAAGSDGDRLLDRLVELRREDQDAQAEEARKLIKEVASWLDDEWLDRNAGIQALTTLEAFSRPAATELAEASGLLVDVASEREAWGTKGEDLLEDLVDLLKQEGPEDWSEDAADLIEDIDDWIDTGELDAARGQRAREILAQLV